MEIPFISTSQSKVTTFFMFEFALKVLKEAIGCTRCISGIGDGASSALLSAIRECGHIFDILKLELNYILESVLRCHHKKTTIDLFLLEVVDDINVFNNYPWGRRCFEDTVHVFTSSHSKPKGSTRKYNTYGLPPGSVGKCLT